MNRKTSSSSFDAILFAVAILSFFNGTICQLLYTKSDVIMGLYMFDRCSNDPYCRFIYQIDELTHSEMDEFKGYFTETETQHVEYLTDENRVGSYSLSSNYSTCTEFLSSCSNTQFSEDSEEDYATKYTFLPMIESIRSVTTESQFAHIKDYVTFSFYSSIDDQVKQYEDQYYQDKFNSDKSDVEEKMSLYTNIALLKLKIVSPNGFGCKNKQQIPTFIKDENRMVCMMDTTTSVYSKKEASKMKTATTSSDGGEILYMENYEVQCDDNKLVLTFVILTFISTVALLLNGIWLFIKIHN